MNTKKLSAERIVEAAIRYPVATAKWMQANSENIVIATDDCGYTFAKADMAGEIGNPADVFTGV